MKIDRKESQRLISSRIYSINTQQQQELTKKLRGNEYTIAKRLLHDFTNAFNNRRTQAPRIENIAGEYWLRTSPALIASAEQYSFTTRTASNCLARLVQRDLDGRGFRFVLAHKHEGNDWLLLLNEAFFSVQEEGEQAPPPYKPPDEKGKADIDAVQEAEMARKVRKLQAKYAK